MFLVTGATGNVGGEVVRALLERDQPVRALTRAGKEAALPAAVDVVEGDLNEPSGLVAAMAGVKGVFLLPGYADMPALLDVVRRAGSERVVLLSGGSAGSGDLANVVTAFMVASEEAVRDSGLPATILRPTEFMSNTLRWVPQLAAGDVVHAPFASVGSASIDPRDIAAVTASALLTSEHEGQTYRISGPETLRAGDRVRILGEVLGRDLRLEAETEEDARRTMTAAMPVEYVDAFFDFYAAGSLDESAVLPTFEELMGRPPGNFEQWAHAHAEAFDRPA
jgi:uncharacterized protein YbjT (DUF2867 family)